MGRSRREPGSGDRRSGGGVVVGNAAERNRPLYRIPKRPRGLRAGIARLANAAYGDGKRRLFGKVENPRRDFIRRGVCGEVKDFLPVSVAEESDTPGKDLECGFGIGITEEVGPIPGVVQGCVGDDPVIHVDMAGQFFQP